MPALNDIIEIEIPASQMMWWEIPLLSLLVLIVLGVLFSLLKKQRVKSHGKLSLIDTAISQLNSLEAQSTNSNRLAVHLSLIIRQYLQGKFNNQALFETDEEFHEHSHDLEQLPDQVGNKLLEYMAEVSAHKYSPDSNTSDALKALTEKASTLLRQIDSIHLSE